MNAAREGMQTRTPLKFADLSRTLSRMIPVYNMLHDPPPAYDAQPCNVIIFGETGTGKSSVVNLIAGSQLARTSPDAGACTFTSTPYHVVLQNNRPFCIWDTVGLNEPEISQDDYLGAIKQAYKLIKQLERSGGVHLLLLCMRGRITKSVEQNYKLFFKIFCEEKVPIGVIVTNLENEPDMEGWWTANEDVFRRYRISTQGHACITASPGVENVFRTRYDESRERMCNLLLGLTLPSGGWWKERQEWISDLLRKMAMMLPRRSDRPTSKELADKLVKECGYSRKQAAEIASAIMTVRRSQTAELGNTYRR